MNYIVYLREREVGVLGPTASSDLPVTGVFFRTNHKYGVGTYNMVPDRGQASDEVFGIAFGLPLTIPQPARFSYMMFRG